MVVAQKPYFETENQYLGVIWAFTLAHFIVRDPVVRWERILLALAIGGINEAAVDIKLSREIVISGLS